MNRLQPHVVVLILVCLKPTGAFPQSGLDLGGSRTRRDVPCRDNLEYPNGNICCLNCPAGTYMKSPCSRTREKGQCEECEHGTFTEHDNGLKQCFPCTQCLPDQEIVRPCTSTHNAECQCKSGRFCAPDEACEVCKKCSRCKKDEVTVRNCTSTTNTECKKLPPASGSASAAWIVPLVLIAVVVIVGALLCWWRRSYRATDSERNPAGGLKAGPDYSDNTEEKRNGQTRKPSYSTLFLPRVSVRAKSSAANEDECKELCESLTSSASNSQHSLTGLPPAFPASPPRASPVVSRPLNNRLDEPLLKVVPVNGEESLRSCFEFFEDIDVTYHSRFFRHLGISDNLIKSKESLSYVDRVHDLLNVWLEKEGRDASLNDLLKALLDLNQRRSAESIKEKAVERGHYICE